MANGFVIGNSHIGALKAGWTRISDEFPQTRVDFFGSAGTSLSQVKVSGGKIFSDEPYVRKSFKATGGAEEISLDGYDFACVVGSGIDLRHALTIVKNFPPYPYSESPMSRDLIAALTGEKLRNTIAMQLISDLHGAVDIPIFCIANPYISEAMGRDDDASIRASSRKVHHHGLGEIADGIFIRACTALFAGLATFIPQNEETKVDHIFSRERFARSKVGLKIIHNVDGEGNDGVHMNGEYGAIILRDMLARLAELSGRQMPPLLSRHD